MRILMAQFYHERDTAMKIAMDNKGQDLEKAAMSKLYISRGLAYEKMGEYDQATQDFDKAISIDPGLIQAYAARGEAYEEKGEYKKAIADFNKAFKIDSRKTLSSYQHWDTDYLNGDHNQALAVWHKAVILDPLLNYSHR